MCVLISLMKIYNMKKFITILSMIYLINALHPFNVKTGIHKEKFSLDYLSSQVRSCGSPRYPATIKAKRESTLIATYKLD